MLATVLRLVAAASGVILAGIALLYYVSGLCLRSPEAWSMLSRGLLDYNTCSILHLELLPKPAVLVAYVHAVATAETLSRSVPGSARAAKLAVEVYRLTVYAAGAAVAALAFTG